MFRCFFSVTYTNQIHADFDIGGDSWYVTGCILNTKLIAVLLRKGKVHPRTGHEVLEGE
jgi:hypothetical protein